MIMIRTLYISSRRFRASLLAVLLMAGCGVASAQSDNSERYGDLLVRTEGLPAYEAMFHMLAFQRFHPENAPIYYRLGDVVYTLLPSKDALHNYDERAELLYKARLFYGNCLHFLDGRIPRGETFPTIVPAGKKLEYSDLETYLRGRLDTISRWRAETDTLHNRFYRMVDRYEMCRQLFLQFLEKYPSEKLAHLCFTEEDRAGLQQLTQLTRLMEQDKQLFTQALAASPVPHYAPKFRSVAITAYRLDGVTSSDFLANDIPLWDYAGWANTFLDVQQRIYQPFMRDLVQEYTMLDYAMQRFRQGQPVQIDANKYLANRVECYDYNSPIATFIRLEQEVAVTVLQAQDSLTTAEQISDGDLSARITANIEVQHRMEMISAMLKEFRQRIDDATAMKYAYFLRETKLMTVEQLIHAAEQADAFQQFLTLQINAQLHNYAAAYPQQFEEVDISDDKAASDAAEASAK